MCKAAGPGDIGRAWVRAFAYEVFQSTPAGRIGNGGGCRSRFRPFAIPRTEGFSLLFIASLSEEAASLGLFPIPTLRALPVACRPGMKKSFRGSVAETSIGYVPNSQVRDTGIEQRGSHRTTSFCRARECSGYMTRKQVVMPEAV